MYPVSAAFRAAVKGSHKATLRAEIWSGGQKVMDVHPVSGEMVNDARRAIRRTVRCDLIAEREILTIDEVNNTYGDLESGFATYGDLEASVATYAQFIQVVGTTTATSPDPLVPGSTGQDALAPYGNELRVWRGIIVQIEVPSTYASLESSFATYAELEAAYATYGTIEQTETIATVDEEVPLGVFILTEVSVTDDGDAIRLSVQGEDRARRISRNRWTSPYQVSAGTNAVDAITALLQNRWDDIEIVSTSTTQTVGSAVFGQETDNDPWKDAQKLALAAGLDLYFDGEGRAVIAAVPSLEDASPDFTFREGADGVLLGLSRSANTNTTYNGVVATGEGTSADTPVRAEAWDEDPASPTYRYGSFGQVPRFFSSPLMTTVEQAQSAAESLLRKVTGLSEGLEWSLVTDPSVEAGDLAEVVSAATRVSRVIVLDAVTVPFTPGGSMAAVGRTVAQVEEAS